MFGQKIRHVAQNYHGTEAYTVSFRAALYTHT